MGYFRKPGGIAAIFYGSITIASFAIFPAAVYWMFCAYGHRPKVADELARVRIENREKIEARDRDILSSYGWINETEGIARLPIAKAMELEIERLKKKTVVASNVPVQPATPPAASTSK